MNQNMNQNNQEIQPVEVVDLSKTQVLNFNDVEETAIYEQKTSKRPIFMLALAGLFSIVMGFLYPVIMHAIDGDEEETPVVESSVYKSALNCKIEANNSIDGTNSVTNVVFNFENSMLVSYTKTLSMLPITNNSTGTATITNYLASYKALESNTIAGYVIKSESVDTGFNSTLTVDLKKFNINSLTDTYTSTSFTNVNYELNQNYDKVKEQMNLAGYTCDR